MINKYKQSQKVSDNTPPARPKKRKSRAQTAHPERKQRRFSHLQVDEVHHAARRDCSSHTDRLHDPSPQLSGIHHHTCESGVVTTPRRLANSPLHGNRDSFLRTAELSSASFIALSLSLLLWYVRPTSNNLGVECSAPNDSSKHPSGPSGRYTSRQHGTALCNAVGGQYKSLSVLIQSVLCDCTPASTIAVLV